MRAPNTSFDGLDVWDDIMTSRFLFIDLYSKQIKNFPLRQIIMGEVPDSIRNPSTVRISDLHLNLHIQAAKGALKMGAFDTSDRYLKKF